MARTAVRERLRIGFCPDCGSPTGDMVPASERHEHRCRGCALLVKHKVKEWECNDITGGLCSENDPRRVYCPDEEDQLYGGDERSRCPECEEMQFELVRNGMVIDETSTARYSWDTQTVTFAVGPCDDDEDEEVRCANCGYDCTHSFDYYVG